MLCTVHQNEIDSATNDFTDESGRFMMILNKHLAARGKERHRLRSVLVKYLRFSAKPNELISDLIEHCIELKSPNRLDTAVDILCELGESICEYAHDFAIADIKNYNRLYSGRRAYRPSDDYWYVMLRSVARSEADESRKLSLLKMCGGADSRGVLESVVESLGDIATPAAMALLHPYTTNPDGFISRLAKQLLEEA